VSSQLDVPAVHPWQYAALQPRAAPQAAQFAYASEPLQLPLDVQPVQ
jgi:hypothetical protein